MADTTLTQSGAEVQADLDKVEGLANIKSVGTGLTLTSAGEIQVTASGGKLYCHTITYLCTDTNDELKLIVYSRDNTPATTWGNVKDLIYAGLYVQGLARLQASGDKFIFVGTAIAITYGLMFTVNANLSHTDLGGKTCIIYCMRNGEGAGLELVQYFQMGTSPTNISVTDVVTPL